MHLCRSETTEYISSLDKLVIIPALPTVLYIYRVGIHSLMGFRPVISLPLTNRSELIDHSRSAFGNTTSLTPDSGSSLSNSRCTVSGTRAAVVRTAQEMTNGLPMTFTSSPFLGGLRSVYANAFDINGTLSHWVKAGISNAR